MKTNKQEIATKQIEAHILLVRGHKVMLDTDLAGMYEVEVKALNRAVKRNIRRFPADFMFQLSPEEALRCQFGTLNKHRGKHRKYLPYAFTEQGVAMLSSVLHSPRAIDVNIEIMRAFIKLRELLTSHKELARKLSELEEKYDAQFQVVFDAIREMMKSPSNESMRPIGYAPWPENDKTKTTKKSKSIK